MTVNALIDRWVEKLAAGGVSIEPAAVRLDLTTLEQRLPDRLPPSFRSLVSRYAFPAFEIAPLWFFANTGGVSDEEWQCALFADPHLSQTLLVNGYVPFARPDTGSYDPICFDTRRRNGRGECPMVWIDHEEILCYDKIAVRQQLAPSFVEFVQADLASGEVHGHGDRS